MNRKELKKIAEKIINIVLKKNKLYGNSYETTRSEYGEVIFLARLDDKLNRLKSLILKKLISEEGIEDTLIDIAGYVILELWYREKKRINF